MLRYGRKEELENFLKAVCLPQPGLWILIGMQVVAKKHLPQIVFDKCPEKTWINIRSLSKTAVAKIIVKNKIAITLPKEQQQFTSLEDKIYEITDGNPLHLRYTLQELKNKVGNAMLTEYACEGLIAYDDNIEKYYESIWKHISENAQTILLTVISVNFLFTEEQLIKCISQIAKKPSDISDGFSSIAHLVRFNYRSQISIYHNSFEVFLKNSKEYKLQKTALKTNVKT